MPDQRTPSMQNCPCPWRHCPGWYTQVVVAGVVVGVAPVAETVAAKVGVRQLCSRTTSLWRRCCREAGTQCLRYCRTTGRRNLGPDCMVQPEDVTPS